MISGEKTQEVFRVATSESKLKCSVDGNIFDLTCWVSGVGGVVRGAELRAQSMTDRALRRGCHNNAHI